uniref:hypothetical protein n=1 Tax=Thaumasiovibrio occultus TaxID=1891184 RepID=UPI000B353D4E|nr:hypothetical protein [Thaumasiovibrio occultus]
MRKITWKTTLLASSIALALTACNSDESSGSASSSNEPVQFAGLKTPVNITFTDPDGQPLEDVTFTIDNDELEVQGADEDDDEYLQEELAVSISRSSIDQVDAINFKIVATADDYLTNSAEIELPALANVLDDAEVVGEYRIVLTPKSTDNAEFAAQSDEELFEADDDGMIAQDINLITPETSANAAQNQAMAGASATLNIPAGTTLLDSDGNPVKGQITANVVHYSNEPGDSEDKSALNALPGGLSPNGVVDEFGATIDVAFISAGYTAIEVTNEQGQVVKSVEGGNVNLAMKIPQDTINPVTGTQITTGDEVPLWGYDSTTGNWQEEGSAQVGELDTTAGTYTISKEIDELNYYHFNWYGIERCEVEVDVLNNMGGSNDVRLGIHVHRAGGGYQITDIMDDDFDELELEDLPFLIGENNQPIELELSLFDPQFPDNTQLLQSAVDKYGNTLLPVNGVLTANLCDLDGGTITVDTQELPDDVEAEVRFVTQCVDGSNREQIEGYYHAYSKIDGNLQFIGGGYADEDGDELEDLYLGRTYLLRGYAYSEDIGYQLLGEQEFTASAEENEFVFVYNRWDGECGTGATGSGSGSGGSNGGVGG